MWGLVLGAASVGVGYLIVALTPIATLTIWDYGTWDSFLNLGRLLLICLAIFASFIAIGVMIATLFARQTEQDRSPLLRRPLGAGLACAVVVYFLDSDRAAGHDHARRAASSRSPASASRSAIAADRSEHAARLVPVGLVVAVLLAIPVVAPSVLPRQREDTVKTNLTDQNTDLLGVELDLPGRRRRHRPGRPEKILYHDGLHGSGIYRFNGDVTTPQPVRQRPAVPSRSPSSASPSATCSSSAPPVVTRFSPRCGSTPATSTPWS